MVRHLIQIELAWLIILFAWSLFGWLVGASWMGPRLSLLLPVVLVIVMVARYMSLQRWHPRLKPPWKRPKSRPAEDQQFRSAWREMHRRLQFCAKNTAANSVI